MVTTLSAAPENERVTVAVRSAPVLAAHVNGTADVTVWGNLEDSESGAADSIRFVIQPDTQGAQPVTLSGITMEDSPIQPLKA